MKMRSAALSIATLVVVLGFAWWVVSVERTSETEDAGRALAPAVDEDVAPESRAETSGPQAQPGGDADRLAAEARPAPPDAGGEDERAADLKAPPAPRESELDALLFSFFGPEPRIDDLQAALGELAARAAVDPASVRTDPESGVVTGDLAIEGTELAGTFRIEGDAYSVTLTQNQLGRDWLARQLTVRFDVADGALRDGSVVVQHHLDYRDGMVRELFAAGERPVGWNVDTSLESGTVARPIVASRTEDGLAVRVGRPTTDANPPIEQPGDWDLHPYASWRARLDSSRR